MSNPTDTIQIFLALEYIAIIFICCSPIIIYLIFKFYLPGYLSEKGRNLATKDDIEEITQKIEQVKNEYAKELDQHRSGIWLQQQRIVWLREEFSLKLETHKRSILLANQCNNLIADFQAAYASREVNGLISQLKPMSEDNRNYFRREYDTAMTNLSEAIINLDRLNSDLKEVCSILEIYFGDEIAIYLKDVIEALKKASDFHWERANFEDALEKYILQNTSKDYSLLAHKCVGEYLKTAGGFGTSNQTSVFLTELKHQMKKSRVQVLDITL